MSDRKIVRNQKATSTFDLDKYLNKSELPHDVTEDEVAESDQPKAKPKESVKKDIKKPAKKKKETKELLTERAQVRLTAKEWEIIDQKRGGEPRSTFLRRYMKEAGLI